ncbi:MAG: hypothetical protein UIC45_07365 [Paludibacteraceae bacterium]|nr:hypothetical protein [Paludibacteraceae bacterium]
MFQRIINFISTFSKHNKDKQHKAEIDLNTIKMSQIDMTVEERIRSRWPKSQWSLMRLGALECLKKGLPMNSQEIQQQAGHIWKKNQKR